MARKSGGLIQLVSGLDLDTLGLTRSGRIICEALQEYGAFVGDYSGAMNLCNRRPYPLMSSTML